MKSIISLFLLISLAILSGCSSHSSVLAEQEFVEQVTDYNSGSDQRATYDDDDSVRGYDIISRKFKELYQW